MVTTQPTSTPQEQHDIVLAESGFTAFSTGNANFASYAVIFENRNPDAAFGQLEIVTLTMKDAVGLVVAIASRSSRIPPGDRFGLAGRIGDAGAATMLEVQFHLAESVTIDEMPGYWEVVDVTTQPHEVGGWHTAGRVISHFATDRTGVSVDVVYRNSDGALVGGDSSFLALIPAGGASDFDVPTLAPFVDIGSTEVYVGLGASQ